LRPAEYIFLTYVNRSGSTYLASILSGSEEILVCPESDLLVEVLLENPGEKVMSPGHLIDRLNQYFRHDNKLMSWNLPQLENYFIEPGIRKIEVFFLLLDLYRNQTKPAAEKILFKSERLVFLMDKLVKTGVPGISFRFISIVRDPRAVYYSQAHTMVPETGKAMTHNVVHTGIYWNRHILHANILKQNLPLFIVKYEDLIDQPGPTMNTLANYLNIATYDYDPGKGDLFDRLPVNHRDIHRQILQNPLTEKLDAWSGNMDDRIIVMMESVAGRGMDSMSYKKNKVVRSGLRYFHLIFYNLLSYHFQRAINIVIFRINRLAR